MQMERRALYNSLRIHWMLDPTIKVEPWQVLDYRTLSWNDLFQQLKEFDIDLDKSSFLAYAQNYDTPEELADDLAASESEDPDVHDRIYLLIFELWRRLLPEKLCLSVFCDELDYQISAYDNGKLSNLEPLEDALANLQLLLEENTDSGANPQEIFASLKEYCANDIETFLYDFTAEQLDGGNNSFAQELLDGFGEYVEDTKWFEFVRARLLAGKDPEEANQLVAQIIKNDRTDPDLEFNLEILAFLVKDGDQKLFLKVANNSLPLMKTEEDFQEILQLCLDYFHYLDNESKEKAVQAIKSSRKGKPLDGPFSSEDPNYTALKDLLK